MFGGICIFKDEVKNLNALRFITAAVIIIFGACGIAAVIMGEHMYFVCLSVWTIAGLCMALFHGIPTIGAKNVAIVIFIGMAVSLFFEAMGVNFGLFFSKYYYTDFIPGPLLFGFNVYSMIAYGIGIYLIWAVAQAAVGQYDSKFEKGQVVLIPLIAGLLFAVVDLATDPLLATISGTHIWEQPGVYYGIPYQNYLGWYVMAYAIFQVVAIVLWSQDRKGKLPKPSHIARKKQFWAVGPILYGALVIQFPFYAMIKENSLVTNIHGQSFWTSEIYWGVLFVMIGSMLIPALLILAKVLGEKRLQ